MSEYLVVLKKSLLLDVNDIYTFFYFLLFEDKTVESNHKKQSTKHTYYIYKEFR